MDCVQALAIAAAALVLAGQPLGEPMARAHEALIVAVSDGEVLMHDAACAAEATWASMIDGKDHHTELALQLSDVPRSAPNIPDARIHAAFRRPI